MFRPKNASTLIQHSFLIQPSSPLGGTRLVCILASWTHMGMHSHKLTPPCIRNKCTRCCTHVQLTLPTALSHHTSVHSQSAPCYTPWSLVRTSRNHGHIRQGSQQTDHTHHTLAWPCHACTASSFAHIQAMPRWITPTPRHTHTACL